MKITVKKITGHSTVNINGKDLPKIQFITSDDEVMETFAKVEEGQEYEGEVTENKFGKQFKKAQTGGFGGFKNDPNTRKEIIRQNSLTNAVNYVLGKASHMTNDKALEYINGKEVIQVATYFAKYSEGDISVVTESKVPVVGDSDSKKPQATSSESIALDKDEMNFDEIFGDE